MKLKLSTAKKSKTATFSRVFHPKKSTIFLGNQSWIFGQKMKISNSVYYSKRSCYYTPFLIERNGFRGDETAHLHTPAHGNWLLHNCNSISFCQEKIQSFFFPFENSYSIFLEFFLQVRPKKEHIFTKKNL